MIIVYRFVSRFIWCLEKVLLIQPIEAIQV